MQLEVIEEQQPELVATLVAAVRDFNTATIGGSGSLPLAVVARDEAGRLLGGVAGRTVYGHFLIDVLWVDASLRGTGVGRSLMEAAEQRARQRGCVAAQVDTLSFQAPGFYQRLGFEVIGTVPDFPKGHARHFLLKRYGESGSGGS